MSCCVDRFSCTIPFPPSVNHMYATNMGSRRIARYKTKAARKFMNDAVLLLRAARPAGWESRGTFAIAVGLILPDRRKRDADNHIKAVQDAIQAAGIVHDDCMVSHITIEKWGVERGGAAHIRILRTENGIPGRDDVTWLLGAE